jgi:hypothetical protein
VQCELARLPVPAPPGVESARLDALRARERKLGALHEEWTRHPCVRFHRGFADAAITSGFAGDLLAALRDEPTLVEVRARVAPSGSFFKYLAESAGASRLRRMTAGWGKIYDFQLDDLWTAESLQLRELCLPSCGLDRASVMKLARWRGIARADKLDLSGNRLPPETRRELAHIPTLREILL